MRNYGYQNLSRPWWETMPVEPQKYREPRRTITKADKISKALTEIALLKAQGQLARNATSGWELLKAVKR